MKISLYWPTRKRTAELSYSIASFIQSAHNPSCLEVIVAFDKDDSDTEDAIKKINKVVKKVSGNDIVTIKSERYGYEYADRYINDAAKIFIGDCFISLNDDMFCNEIGWDEILISSIKDHITEPLFIWPDCDTNRELPPMPRVMGINREWYEKTQHFSGWRAADEYLPKLVRQADIKTVRPKFEIYHLRQLEDETYKEGRGLKPSFTRGGMSDDVPGDFERDFNNLRKKSWWETDK